MKSKIIQNQTFVVKTNLVPPLIKESIERQQITKEYIQGQKTIIISNPSEKLINLVQKLEMHKRERQEELMSKKDIYFRPK